MYTNIQVDIGTLGGVLKYRLRSLEHGTLFEVVNDMLGGVGQPVAATELLNAIQQFPCHVGRAGMLSSLKFRNYPEDDEPDMELSVGVCKVVANLVTDTGHKALLLSQLQTGAAYLMFGPDPWSKHRI
jgi:hypothetical protein